MRRRSLVTIPTLLLCCSPLVACGEDSSSTQAEPSPTAPTTTAPTIEPTASDTVAPTPTQTPSELSTPESVVRAFVDAYNQLQLDGDRSTWDALTQDCAVCDGVASEIVKVYAAGGYITGGGWQISKLKRSMPSKNGDLAVTFDVVQDATHVVKEKGAKVEDLPGGRTVYRCSLSPVNGSWKVFDVIQVAQ